MLRFACGPRPPALGWPAPSYVDTPLPSPPFTKNAGCISPLPLLPSAKAGLLFTYPVTPLHSPPISNKRRSWNEKLQAPPSYCYLREIFSCGTFIRALARVRYACVFFFLETHFKKSEVLNVRRLLLGISSRYGDDVEGLSCYFGAYFLFCSCRSYKNKVWIRGHY